MLEKTYAELESTNEKFAGKNEKFAGTIENHAGDRVFAPGDWPYAPGIIDAVSAIKADVAGTIAAQTRIQSVSARVIDAAPRTLTATQTLLARLNCRALADVAVDPVQPVHRRRI